MLSGTCRSPSLVFGVVVVLQLATSAASAVPSPSTAVADMLGVYNWGADYSSYDGSTDRLNWAAAKVAQTGTRTIRVAMTAQDPYLVNPPQATNNDPNWLVNVAATPAYTALFGSDHFRVYLLTTYTPADSVSAWINGFDPSSPGYNLESTQIQNLSAYLHGAYPSKTFIILNWEGDNAMQGALGLNADPSVWDHFVNWLQSRADGVAKAKAAGATNVYFGVEFNLVVARGGEPCGGAPFGGPGNQSTVSNRCVIDYVAPRVRNVDYFSYSSWQTINIKVTQPGASLQQAINTALGGSLQLVRTGQIAFQGQSTVTPASFLLGEFGFARTDYGEYDAARYTEELVDAVQGPGAFGASYAIFWQILDNAPPPWNSWGLFRGSNGQITTVGTTFTELMNGETPNIPTNGPEISPGGILNADPGPEEGTRSIHPNTTVSILGLNFSPSGNVVSVIQGTQRYLLQAGSPNWFESPTQINARFPNITSQASVFVTTGGGIDSKAQFVTATSSPAPPPVLAVAVLPSSRSVQVGVPATAFVTVINTAAVPARGVGMSLGTGILATFAYRTTDPTTNAVTGPPNVAVDIPAGHSQSYVIAVTPTAALSPTDVRFVIAGTNTDLAPTLLGVNTLLLSASAAAVPDIVALAASGDPGIVDIPGPTGTGAFAVATVNVGNAGGLISVGADTSLGNTPRATLGVTTFVCQTNPTTGQCLAPPQSTVATQINPGETPTFAIFVQGSGPVSFDPANNRIFVRFTDAGGVIRGATSVAVRTQ